MKNNQKGFGAIEGILIVILIGMIGFVGWFVWHSQKNADTSYNNASSASSSPTKAVRPPAGQAAELDTTNWLTATLPTEKISFKYPKSWNLDTTHYAKDSGPGAYNDGDQAILNTTDGFRMSITTGTSDGEYGDPKDKVFEKDQFTLNGQPAYALVTGYAGNGSGAQNVEASSKDQACAVNCRLNNKNSAGTISINGGFTDDRELNKNYDPTTFKNNPTIKQALLVIKSLTY